MSALHTGMDSTNESKCGGFGSLVSAINTILHHWPMKERVCMDLTFRNNTSAGLIIQNSLYNSSNLIDVFRYKLHSFFEITILDPFSDGSHSAVSGTVWQQNSVAI
jgi:hypothetical protein